VNHQLLNHEEMKEMRRSEKSWMTGKLSTVSSAALQKSARTAATSNDAISKITLTVFIDPRQINFLLKPINFLSGNTGIGFLISLGE
jgi:hypothetical protein